MAKLQDRDNKALTHLLHVNYIDTTTLGQLFYRYNEEKGKINKYYKDITRTRIRKMRDELGLIKSFDATNNSDQVHTLTSKGILYVGGLYNLNTTSYKEKNGFLELASVKHSLELNKIVLGIYEGQWEDLFRIVLLELENQNRRQFDYVDETYRIKPDIFCIIEKNHKGYSYYIEVDNNTEGPKKIKTKLETYQKYYTSGAIYSEEWQEGSKIQPNILYVCDTEKRASKIKKIQNKLGNKLDAITKNELKSYF